MLEQVERSSRLILERSAYTGSSRGSGRIFTADGRVPFRESDLPCILRGKSHATSVGQYVADRRRAPSLVHAGKLNLNGDPPYFAPTELCFSLKQL